MFRIHKSTELDHWLPVGKGMVGGNGESLISGMDCFLRQWNVLEVDNDGSYITMNILKTTELYSLICGMRKIFQLNFLKTS